MLQAGKALRLGRRPFALMLFSDLLQWMERVAISAELRSSCAQCRSLLQQQALGKRNKSRVAHA